MLKGQKHSFDKSELGFDKTIVSNIASSSKTVFVKPEVVEPQNACEDKGKALVISCENANIKSVVPIMKHSKSRSMLTCHHCGSLVTSDYTILRSILKSLESRSKSQRKVNLAINLLSLIMLLGKSGYTPKGLLPHAVTVIKLATTRPTVSN
jgi:hypothetical protein